MRPYELKVVGLEADGDKGQVKLEGKFHRIFTSQVFLKVPVEELSKFEMGDRFSLVAGITGSDECATVPIGDAHSRFEDGSPVPAGPQSEPLAELDDVELDEEVAE